MAREFFEERTLSGRISITMEKGRPKWSADKSDLVKKIIATVNEYAAQGYKLTLRQLYYQLVSKEYIPNHDKVYKKLSTILDDCRYSGVIDWNMIEDRGRVPSIPYCNENVAQALQDAVRTYRLDRMIGQEVYIEVWTEKDAISGILSRVTREYHVHLVVNKGYISSSAMHNAYKRFLYQFEEQKEVYILYFGDHDPSGLDMVRDINDRLHFMFENGDNELQDTGYNFTVIPIGLTMNQIKKYSPPPNPAKITDPRAANYIKEFGAISWEVDALPPPVMAKIVEDNIEKLINKEQRDRQMNEEVEGKKKITNIVASLDKPFEIVEKVIEWAFERDDKIILYDGKWYFEYDSEANNPMSFDEVHKLYLEANEEDTTE